MRPVHYGVEMGLLTAKLGRGDASAHSEALTFAGGVEIQYNDLILNLFPYKANTRQTIYSEMIITL